MMLLEDIFPWIFYLWYPVGWIIYPVHCIWTLIRSSIQSLSYPVCSNTNRYNSNHDTSNHNNSNHDNSNHDNSNHNNSNHNNSNHNNSNHDNSNHNNSNHDNSNHDNSNHNNSNHNNSNNNNSNHNNSNHNNSNPNLLTLGGVYEIEFLKKYSLGRGGFGEVFRGRNIHTREEVALKRVDRDNLTEKYLERELSFKTVFDHKNIIKFLWTGEDEYYGYFVMEYCPCGNLNTFMKDREIPLVLCHSFMRNLAEAVLHIHQKLISHRDINPWNVLVKQDEDGGYYLLLADFGLARYFPVTSSGILATGNTGNIFTSL